MIFLGFFIGLRPDLGTKFILDKAFKHFGLLGEQSDFDAKTVPSNFSLMLIEGPTDEKQSRLDELSIDNCQALAGHNSFIIWARTSYQLLHIVDWIAHAQLCLLVGPEGTSKQRTIGIRDIFGLEAAWTGASAAAVTNVLGYPQQLEKDIVNYLVENPAFKRLKQVYKCLCDDPAHNTDKPPN